MTFAPYDPAGRIPTYPTWSWPDTWGRTRTDCNGYRLSYNPTTVGEGVTIAKIGPDGNVIPSTPERKTQFWKPTLALALGIVGYLTSGGDPDAVGA